MYLYMLPIIKIYYQGEKEVTKHIYVFLNNNWIENNILSLEDSLDALKDAAARKDPTSLKFIFSESELRKIYSENIPITFLAETLHTDDTILTIKGKIIEYTNLSLSLPEMYLYGIHREKLRFQTISEKLTQDGELPLTRERLLQFLQNFVRFNIDDFKSVGEDEFQNDLLPYTEIPELIKFPHWSKIYYEKKPPLYGITLWNIL